MSPWWTAFKTAEVNAAGFGFRTVIVTNGIADLRSSVIRNGAHALRNPGRSNPVVNSMAHAQFAARSSDPLSDPTDDAHTRLTLRFDERQPLTLDRPYVAGPQHNVLRVVLLRKPDRALRDPHRRAPRIFQFDEIPVRKFEYLVVAIAKHRCLRWLRQAITAIYACVQCIRCGRSAYRHCAVIARFMSMIVVRTPFQ